MPSSNRLPYLSYPKARSIKIITLLLDQSRLLLFRFASKARPVPGNIRSPSFGTHKDLLFNQKCQLLKQLGVLIDPIEHNIQPLMTHNTWVVKKPSATSKRWEKCTLKDTRLVVSLHPINKFLVDLPPGKVTETDFIYTALANWEFMGKLDF